MQPNDIKQKQTDELKESPQTPQISHISNPQLTANTDAKTKLSLSLQPLPSSPVLPTGQTQIMVGPQPVRLEIDQPKDWIDWLGIGVPLLLAYIGYRFTQTTQREQAAFTEMTQRQQIRSNIANFRHTWQQDLRATIAEFMSACAELQLHALRKGDTAQTQNPFIRSDEGHALLSRCLRARYMVTLMLDEGRTPEEKQQRQHVGKIFESMKQVMLELENHDYPKVRQHMSTLVSCSRLALEGAWEDIRTDLQYDH